MCVTSVAKTLEISMVKMYFTIKLSNKAAFVLLVKEGHTMKKQTNHHRECSLCGNSHYEAFAFKTGQVCEDCLRVLKSLPPDENLPADPGR